MATLPFRFECDLEIDENSDVTPKIGVPDPLVRVFFGETYTNDSTKEKALNKQILNAAYVKLSNLEEFLKLSISGVPDGMLPPKYTLPSTAMIKMPKDKK
jgi:hypothetical protein